MFALNDVEKGGSFYLQSKIYRAEQRFQDEFKIRGIVYPPAVNPGTAPPVVGAANGAEATGDVNVKTTKPL